MHGHAFVVSTRFTEESQLVQLVLIPWQVKHLLSHEEHNSILASVSKYPGMQKHN